MACLRKRRSKWVVDFRIGHQRKTPSFDTKAEAEAFKRELLLRPIDSMTGYSPIVDTLLVRAINDYKTQVTSRKALRTFEVDNMALTRLENKFKGLTVSQICYRDLDLFQLELAKKLSAATVNRQFNVIKHFFKKCVEWNFIRENPTQNLKCLKETMKVKIPLTDDQINLVINSLPTWATDAFYFIAKTGLRRGQACSLKWEHVNFSHKAFQTKSVKGGYEKVYELPLTDELHSFLLEKWNLRHRVLQKSEFVLLGPDNSKIKPPSLTQVVIRLRDRIGIPNAGLHILRHTILTRLGENNNNGATIQRIAGHSSLTTTQRYLHPHMEETRKSLESLKDRQIILRKRV